MFDYFAVFYYVVVTSPAIAILIWLVFIVRKFFFKKKSASRILLVTAILYSLIAAYGIYSVNNLVKMGNERSANKIHNESEEDFQAVLNFKKPTHAEPIEWYADGGTILYKGYGYFIEVRKQIEEQNNIQGFIYGPRIIYKKNDEKGIPLEKSDFKFYPTEKLVKLLESSKD